MSRPASMLVLQRFSARVASGSPRRGSAAFISAHVPARCLLLSTIENILDKRLSDLQSSPSMHPPARRLRSTRRHQQPARAYVSDLAQSVAEAPRDRALCNRRILPYHFSWLPTTDPVPMRKPTLRRKWFHSSQRCRSDFARLDILTAWMDLDRRSRIDGRRG